MSKLDVALKELGDFIRAVHEDITTAESTASIPEASRTVVPGVMFSLKDYGALTLDGKDAEEFQILLNRAISAVGDRTSKRFVEGHIQDCVLRTLDINGITGVPFDQRLKANLQALKSSLLKPSRRWLVYLRVEGLGAQGLPLSVGNATFCVMDDSRVGSLQEILSAIVDSTKNSDEVKTRVKQESKDDIHGRLRGRVVAVVEVPAVESEAAITLAVKELRSTLDAINFFSDLLVQRGLRCRVRLPSEPQTVNEIIPVYTQEGAPFFSLAYRVLGPLQDLPASVLASPRASELGFPRVSSLLAKPDRNEVEDAVVASLQLAGRATVEERREVAFLLYMIAVESLVAHEGAPEIGYRLGQRIAILLGDDLTRRKRILEIVYGLYDKRSGIAHSGYAEVADADLALARRIAKTAVLRFLLDEPFVSMRERKEIATWLEDQLLG